MVYPNNLLGYIELVFDFFSEKLRSLKHGKVISIVRNRTMTLYYFEKKDSSRAVDVRIRGASIAFSLNTETARELESLFKESLPWLNNEGDLRRSLYLRRPGDSLLVKQFKTKNGTLVEWHQDRKGHRSLGTNVQGSDGSISAYLESDDVNEILFLLEEAHIWLNDQAQGR